MFMNPHPSGRLPDTRKICDDRTGGLRKTGDVLEDLEKLRWKKRVVLIHAPKPLPDVALSRLEEADAGIRERDIAWFLLGEGAVRTNHDGSLDKAFEKNLVEGFFTPAPADPAVILIGKDGEVKSRWCDLDLEAIFGQIDLMPMRLEEMQRQKDRDRTSTSNSPTERSRHD